MKSDPAKSKFTIIARQRIFKTKKGEKRNKLGNISDTIRLFHKFVKTWNSHKHFIEHIHQERVLTFELLGSQ